MRDIHNIIQSWEKQNQSKKTIRLNEELYHLMQAYFTNILPIESFDWLSIKNPKQLCWVLFYLRFNPLKQFYYAPTDKYFRNFASNAKEIYPLIIKTFDAAMCEHGVKQNYLLTMKCSYSQFVTCKSRLPWLNIQDEETCSWVWRYLIEKVEEATGKEDTFQFIKPIDNETVYWSCIALIANWGFLNRQFTEKVKIPTFAHTFTTNNLDVQIKLDYFGDETTTKNSKETESATSNNIDLFKPSDIELVDAIGLNTVELKINTYSRCVIYTDTNYPYEIIWLLGVYPCVENDLFNIRLEAVSDVKIGTLNKAGSTKSQVKTTEPIIKPNEVSKFVREYRYKLDSDNIVGSFYEIYKPKLPTTEELAKSLYNAHKQKILRQKNNNPFGLTKANQKKLANYAKEQNTTEKKALNEIVKAMLD